MSFYLDYLLRRNDSYREYSNFFWLLILLLFVPFYCAYQLSDKDNEARYKDKIELEGFVLSADYYSETCELKLRNYDDDKVYDILIKEPLMAATPDLKKDQLVSIKGYLPERDNKLKVTAKKIKLID